VSLNRGQQAAVDEPGHCLIVACPGSGKTHTLVERAKKILGDNPKARLATVTFTRAAAEEMRERVVKKLGEAIRPRIDAGTFHSLCLKQLDVLSTDGKRPFTIATEGHTHILVAKAWEATIAKFRVAVDRDRLRRGIEFAKANRGHVQPDDYGERTKFALDHYQNQLTAQKLFDFADIIEFTVQGMQGGGIAPLGVTDLLVDEFQDGDAVQVDWVLEHVASGVRVTCVGDDDQSIYGFRHAKGYNGMMLFAQRSRAKIITLDTTYRCTAPVVAHAARLIGNNTTRVAKTIQTANAQQGYVDRRDFSSQDDEVREASKILNDRPKGQTAAILARTNNVLRIFETHMKCNEIPYVGGVDGSIWSDGVPGLIRGLIGAAVGKDPPGITMALAARGMSYSAVKGARDLIQNTGGAFEALLGKEGWLSGLGDAQLRIWAEMKGEFAGLGKLTQGDPMTFVKACAHFIAPGVDGFSNPMVLTDVIGLIDKMKGSLAEIYRKIEQSMRKSDQDKDAKSGIALLTLHASKGLEFDRVWMPAMQQGVLPHGKSDLAEERRLCYVGLTRARAHLTVSYTGTKGAPESVFLKEMGLQNGDLALR